MDSPSSPGINDSADATRRIEAALARIEQRLGLLEVATSPDRILEGRVAPALAALTDAVDHHVGRLQARGVDVDERLRMALELIERVTAPETVRALDTLLDSGALVKGATLAEQAPQMLAGMVDVFDGLAARAHAAGFDFDERLRMLLRAADKLTSREAIEALEHTLHSGILDEAAVETVGRLGRAVAAASLAEPQKVTLWALLRALSEPEVQRALGFLLSFARTFGGSLDKGALPAGAAARLPAAGSAR